MTRTLPCLTVLVAVALAAAPAQAQRPRQGDLKVGDPAPALTLAPLTPGAPPVALASSTGRPLVLIFGSCT